jgi:acyl-CoA synthetase (AMP-forming)/AMP-acid ligase II
MESCLTNRSHRWLEAKIVDGASGSVLTPEAFPLPWASLPVGIVFLLADNSTRSIAHFFSHLHHGIPVVLLDPSLSASSLDRLMQAYEPEGVLFPPEQTVPEALADRSGDFVVAGAWQSSARCVPPHDELAVVLTTSGTTGNPKSVRLSKRGVLSNAIAIGSSLRLRSSDRAVTSLPFHYSYGMSVLTSHAAAGSPIVSTMASVIDPAFWSAAKDQQVSVFAGVPQTYEMLFRLRVGDKLPQSVRTMTQAGGRLRPELIRHFHDLMAGRNGSFHVMYGQTEAGPRMACMPSEQLLKKDGSVGLALDGGVFSVRTAAGGTAGPCEVGEIRYCGPNVMLGYAHERRDFCLGDEQNGELDTGDLGYLDSDGFLFLTGRLSRFAKVAGVRVSLDDVELLAAEYGPIVAVPRGDDGIALFGVRENVIDQSAIRSIASAIKIHPKSLHFVRIDDVPLLPSGKVDYGALVARAKELS